MNGKVKWGALGVIGGGAVSSILPIVTILTDKKPQDIAESWNVWWPVISYGFPFLFATLAAAAVIGLVRASYLLGYHRGVKSCNLQQVDDNQNTSSSPADRIDFNSRPAGAVLPSSSLASESFSTNGRPSHIDTKGSQASWSASTNSSDELASAGISNSQLAEGARAGVPSSSLDLKALHYSIMEVITALTEKGRCRDDVVKRNLVLLEVEHPAWHVDGPYEARAKFIKAARDALAARTEGSVRITNIVGDYPDQYREKHIQKVKSLGVMLRNRLADYSSPSVLR